MNFFLGALLFFGSFALSQATQLNQPAPACPSVQLANQQPFEITAYKNKVLLIDFWATWCTPCLKSMPFFNTLHQEFSKDGLEVLAINLDEDKETAQQFLKAHPVSYPMAFDPIGECPRALEVKAMPSSYLIDKSGNIRFIHLGYRDSDQTELRQKITELLAE